MIGRRFGSGGRNFMTASMKLYSSRESRSIRISSSQQTAKRYVCTTTSWAEHTDAELVSALSAGKLPHHQVIVILTLACANLHSSDVARLAHEAGEVFGGL